MNLLKRDSIYYFRKRIPSTLKMFIKQDHIKISLHTKMIKVAKLRANLIRFRLDKFFLKGQIVDIQKIREVINSYVKEAISEYSEVEELRHKELAFTDNDAHYAGHSEKAIDKEFSRIKSILERGNKEELEITSNSIINRSNIPKEFINELDAREKYVFSYELLKAECQILMYDKARNKDRIEHKPYVEGKDNVFEAFNGVPISLNLIDSLTKQYGKESANLVLNAMTKQEEPINLLSESIEKFLESEKSSRDWSDKTYEAVKAKLVLALRVLGDKDLKQYTREDFENFRNTLLKLPSNMNKMKELKSKSIKEIIALKLPPLGKSTINEYLLWTSALFEWSILRGYVVNNLAKSLKVNITKKSREDRLPFNSEDITLVYETIKATKKSNPERYFITLIALYNGFRLNEIAQLHTEDIREVKGIWCFDINDNLNANGEKAKRVKNNPSKRIVPIHPKLIELGLITYYQQVVKEKHERIFYQLKEERDGYGRTISRFFSNLKKSFIKDNDRKSFHSTRHTFIQKIKNLSIDEHKRKAINGRGDDDIDYSTYGEDFEPQDLLIELEKVSYSEI